MGGGQTTAPYAPATPDAKRYAGFGTGLKPAIEPGVFAMKPLEHGLTFAQNVLKWGTGGLNLDACRIAPGDPAWPGPENELVAKDVPKGTPSEVSYFNKSLRQEWHYDPKGGRFPANIYYCPKPSGGERNEGCDDLPQQRKAQLAGAVTPNDPVSERFQSEPMGNVHPTVKPKKLWRWYMQLVTPPGGTCFESFAGSGTALVAARGLDIRVIAAEREPGYCDIIRARCGMLPSPT